MPSRQTDALYLLVKSLEKSEKRHFKLYVNRNNSSEDLKIVQLFDALDRMEQYDEAVLLKKNPAIKKQQLSNLKAHLYRQVLTSLRLMNDEGNIDILLQELMAQARILFNKGLYLQSLKAIEKLKELSKTNNQFTYLQQALFFEKNIEALFITRSMQDRAERLSQEATEINNSLALVSHLSNLSLQLYSWYIRYGHARNKKDDAEVQHFFKEQLGDDAQNCHTFYEKLYLYQCHCWTAHIRQDFLLYYRYTQKWVNLFDENPSMKTLETIHYIKGLHNLMSSHFNLGNHQKLKETLQLFKQFSDGPVAGQNINNRIHCFIYYYIAIINLYFLEGDFKKGVQLVPEIEEKLEAYSLYLDQHRILIFYYKIASLYFGSSDYETAIDYLNKIINRKVDLRTDLQCYSRLLHLIAHYELNNYEILDHLIKSVYRFMAKMENLSVVEEEIFKFVRRSFHLNVRTIKPEFEKLLVKLKKYQGNHFESRAFMYLDIISWIESKLAGTSVQEVLRRKYILKREGKG